MAVRRRSARCSVDLTRGRSSCDSPQNMRRRRVPRWCRRSRAWFRCRCGRRLRRFRLPPTPTTVSDGSNRIAGKKRRPRTSVSTWPACSVILRTVGGTLKMQSVTEFIWRIRNWGRMPKRLHEDTYALQRLLYRLNLLDRWFFNDAVQWNGRYFLRFPKG